MYTHLVRCVVLCVIVCVLCVTGLRTYTEHV
jgi:hypothetical protein